VASQTITPDAQSFDSIETKNDSLRNALHTVLKPLASLKFTVVLFALAIVLVMIGTLAQARADIWEVIDRYFRTAIAWVPLNALFPPSFFPGWDVSDTIKFPFPGGWTIGALMAVNLLAAHGIRFKIQSNGMRMWLGLAFVAFGMVVTWVVIVSGSNKAGFAGEAIFDWKTVWYMVLSGLFGTWAGTGYAMFQVNSENKVLAWLLGAINVLVGGLFLYYIFQPNAGMLGQSEMRILWQLIKASAAGIVLLIGSILLFKKRGAIVLLHWGIALLMFNELFVGLSVEEAQMTLAEKQSANYVRDIREVELAVIDPSGKETDEVVAIPQSYLKPGETIRHELLPFDIEVVDYLQNSQPRKLKKDEKGLADAGVGLQWTVDEKRPGAGADSESDVDTPAAYLKFIDKKAKDKSKADLGTHLAGVFLSMADFKDSVKTADGKSYDVALRFKRNYKDYEITLLDVRKDDYLGTNTPRNYSSEIKIVDPTRSVDREVKIWMNNPLRFAGETFYQSGYHQDPRTGEEITTLAVVSNAGWMLPYVCCMIVVIGLLAQFGATLYRFLQRLEISGGGESLGLFSGLIFPFIIVLIGGGYLSSKAMPPRTASDEMDLYAFSELPLNFGGRVMPFDTLARNSMMMLSNRQTYQEVVKEGEDGKKSTKKQPAIRWLLDVMAETDEAEKHQVFRIENSEVQDLFGLEKREGLRYTLEELRPKSDEFNKQVDMAREASRKNGPESLSVFQREILELDNRIRRYTLLQASFIATPFPKIPTEAEFQQNRDQALQTVMQAKTLLDRARAADQALSNMNPPLAVPDFEAKAGDSKAWQPFTSAWTKEFTDRELERKEGNPATVALKGIFDAYKAGDAKAFNQGVADYKAMIEEGQPVEFNESKTNLETLFNLASPFYYTSALYVFAFVLTALSWIGWNRPLNRAAFSLILLLAVVHSAALIVRMYINGRPPVTNLYSSAIFIGWACVIFGVVLEMIFKRGIGNVIASVSGFATLGIAYFIAGDSDTLGVMQAVLDTQFWLATHVVCITLGYATTFIAGMLGLIYVIAGVMSPALTSNFGKTLYRITYGAVCFALFFSFFGTVLGGLWADDSWGRFWGWDPKENGALIIVLWNALILHARWGAMIKERGFALLAIFGNIVTAWSWFGVNELGVGLHSYGFTDGALFWLSMFFLSQIVMILVGLIPKKYWWSSWAQGS